MSSAFYSENQSVDFEVELSLYSAKTNGHRDGSQTLKQKLARSLSRKLGASYVSVKKLENFFFLKCS